MVVWQASREMDPSVLQNIYAFVTFSGPILCLLLLLGNEKLLGIQVLGVEASDNTKFIMRNTDHQWLLAHVLWACVYSVMELLAARHFKKWFAQKCITGSQLGCHCWDSSIQSCKRLHVVFLSTSESWSREDLWSWAIGNLCALDRFLFR